MGGGGEGGEGGEERASCRLRSAHDDSAQICIYGGRRAYSGSRHPSRCAPRPAPPIIVFSHPPLSPSPRRCMQRSRRLRRYNSAVTCCLRTCMELRYVLYMWRRYGSLPCSWSQVVLSLNALSKAPDDGPEAERGADRARRALKGVCIGVDVGRGHCCVGRDLTACRLGGGRG